MSCQVCGERTPRLDLASSTSAGRRSYGRESRSNPGAGVPVGAYTRSDLGAHERAAVDAALALALPAALALEAARYDFATGHARSQWLRLAQEAMRLAFRLAVRRQDQGLLFELVEFRCAGAPLALDRTPPPDSAAGAALFPDGAMKTYGHTPVGFGASDGLRVALPPQVLMSPDHDRTALREYVEAAESRYHRWVVSEEKVPSW